MISAYIFNNMNLVVIALVIAIMFRSVLSDLLLSNDIKLNVIVLEIADIILAIIFMLVANILEWRFSAILLLAVYAIRIILVKTNIIKIKATGEFNYEK